MTSLTELPAGTWNIDPAHSELGFVARHLMVSKVRGTFDEFTATAVVAEDVTASTVEATVQMASVNTGSADRDAHLRSGDFFDVEQYPTMTFVSTKITQDTLTGDLTVHGVTKPITLDIEFGGVATDPWGNTKAGFEATGELSRKEFGMTWNAAVEGGGVMVSDKIKLVLDVQLIKA